MEPRQDVRCHLGFAGSISVQVTDPRTRAFSRLTHVSYAKVKRRFNRDFPMPKFTKSKCSLCDGAACGSEFVCWCPSDYLRAFEGESVTLRSTSRRASQKMLFGPVRPDYSKPYVDPAPRIYYPGTLPP